jgi:hypothetical protein
VNAFINNIDSLTIYGTGRITPLAQSKFHRNRFPLVRDKRITHACNVMPMRNTEPSGTYLTQEAVESTNVRHVKPCTSYKKGSQHHLGDWILTHKGCLPKVTPPFAIHPKRHRCCSLASTPAVDITEK